MRGTWMMAFVLGGLGALGLPARAEGGLTVQFTPRGLASLQYAGQELLGNGAPAAEGVFLRTPDGTVYTPKGQPALTVDVAQQVETLTAEWGTVRVAYAVAGTRLGLTVTVTNTSADVLQGLYLQYFTLKFPRTPAGFDQAGHTPNLGFNAGSPTIVTAEYGAGVVTVCNDDITRPLISGLSWALDKPACTTYAVMSRSQNFGWLTRELDAVVARPVYPGCTDRYTLSLRFGPAGATGEDLAADLYAKCATLYPAQLQWTDHRPIGALFLSTSAAGYPKNPRGWFMHKDLDTTTEEGRKQFTEQLLAYADNSIKELKGMNAQGMIAWDTEGQEYPHATSYLGDPRSLPAEMEAVADAFYRKFTDAGLRVGLCIRPQRPVRAPYTAGVWQAETANPAQTLIDKIAYAKKRWGCTLFYVDSNGDPNVPFDPMIFRQVAAAHPDVLLIPEHENLRYYAYAAPYNELRSGYALTPARVRRAYPAAFSVIYVADADMQQRHAELVDAVKRGDILLFRGWFADTFNAAVKQIYAEAAR